MTAYPHVQV